MPGAASQRYEVIKTYPQRGPMQQYRLAQATAFSCFRCGRDKKAKLVTTFADDWEKLLCNGCYGRLLSLHEIKAGTDSEETRAEALATQLLALASKDEQRRLVEQLVLRDSRAEILDERSLRLLATADFVAEKLESATDLDWSAAIIGQCKAFEVEMAERFIKPLAASCASADLREDIADKDLGRVARYCAGRAEKPPELGAVRHFLETAAN